MNPVRPAAAPIQPPEPDDPRWIASQRVAGSRTFERSNRLQKFLLDVTSHAIAGRREEINEQQIGMRVFGKAAGYNPAEDNTVRVQARLLRQKLEEYYAGDGASDPLQIQIPKGGYVPVFVAPQEPAAPAPPPAEPAQPAAAASPAPAAVVNRALAVLCVVLAIAVAWLWQQKAAAGSRTVLRSTARGSLTSLVTGPSRKTMIVLADSGLVAAETLSGQDITLADYTSSGYRQKVEAARVFPEARAFWGYLLSRRYTSLADVTLYGKLLRLHPDAWPNLQLRHARDLQVRDFRENNFILLGSNRSTPWLELFQDKLAFQFESTPDTHLPLLRNKHPQNGEPAAYYMEAMPNGTGKGYAYLALISNLTNTGSVLVIAGTTMAATDAAAEFACDPEASQTLARSWGLKDLRGVSSFELVFDTSIVSDTVQSVRIVASRRMLQK